MLIKKPPCPPAAPPSHQPNCTASSNPKLCAKPQAIRGKVRRTNPNHATD